MEDYSLLALCLEGSVRLAFFVGFIILSFWGLYRMRQRNKEFYARFLKMEKENAHLKRIIARPGGLIDRIEKLEDASIHDQINTLD